MLILLIIYLALAPVDVPLFEADLPFVKGVFLFVNEMLKLPGLSYSITGVFEPLLISLVFLLHLVRSHLHLSFNIWLVGNGSVLAHDKV